MDVKEIFIVKATILIDGNALPKMILVRQGLIVAQWITHLTTDRKIPGSNHGKVEILLMFRIKDFQFKIEKIVCLGNGLLF